MMEWDKIKRGGDTFALMEPILLDRGSSFTAEDLTLIKETAQQFKNLSRQELYT